jgi:hypothetical protein
MTMLCATTMRATSRDGADGRDAVDGQGRSQRSRAWWSTPAIIGGPYGWLPIGDWGAGWSTARGDAFARGARAGVRTIRTPSAVGEYVVHTTGIGLTRPDDSFPGQSTRPHHRSRTLPGRGYTDRRSSMDLSASIPRQRSQTDYGRYRLIRAGVPTKMHVCSGAFHGFLSFEQTALGQRVRADVTTAPGRALGASGTIHGRYTPRV